MEQPIFSCAEMRAFDRWAAESLGVPPSILMENAGRSLVESLLRHFDLAPENAEPKRILILAGRGNNGGDGFVMARRLHLLGFPVETIFFGRRASSEMNEEPAAAASPKISSYSGESAMNLAILEKLIDERMTVRSFDALGNPALPMPRGLARRPVREPANSSPEEAAREAERRRYENLDEAIRRAAVVVDALLGSGTKGAPRAPFDSVIKRLNAAEKPVFAVDLPSGLDGDTGAASTPTVRAKVTCTLGGMKTGLTFPQAREYAGIIEVGDIGVAAKKV